MRGGISPAYGSLLFFQVPALSRTHVNIPRPEGAHLMSSILYRINHVLSCVVADVPLGTNVGLCHLLWTLLRGRLLQSRGAVIPALADFGLGAAAVRRAWAALAYGHGSIAPLLAAWPRVGQDDSQGQAHRHG